MPRQPVVRHNDWGALTPPALGDWEPSLAVTVVVPTFNYQRTLPYVLAGLAARAGVPASTLGPNTVYGARPGAVIDVTLGQNAPPGACGQSGFDPRLCVSRAGWDGPTGVGVPAGIGVFSGR